MRSISNRTRGKIVVGKEAGTEGWADGFEFAFAYGVHKICLPCLGWSEINRTLKHAREKESEEGRRKGGTRGGGTNDAVEVKRNASGKK